jgi:hypothetical protein
VLSENGQDDFVEQQAAHSMRNRAGPPGGFPISTGAVEKLVGKSSEGRKNMRCDSDLTLFEQNFVQSPQTILNQQFENVYRIVTLGYNGVGGRASCLFHKAPAWAW